LEDQAQADIVILIVAGCLGMLILVAFIILFVLYYQKKMLLQQNQLQVAENKYQRELLNATIKVEQKERERIAKNVHDDLGALLTVAKINLGKIAMNKTATEDESKLVKENMELLEKSIQSVRGIAKDLVSPTLQKAGYFHALKELGTLLNNNGEIKVNIIPESSDRRFEAETESQLYRMTQEVINNILKHSAAREINIEFKSMDAHDIISIKYDAKGISSEEVKQLAGSNKGMGLKSIQSRAQLINTKVNYFVYNEKKSEVKITIPHFNFKHENKDSEERKLFEPDDSLEERKGERK
jgi:signal transduction histidine kinase